MAAVSETITREYFELNGFLVRQHRKHIPRTRTGEDDIDFFVFNPQAETREGVPPFVLETRDLRFIERAIVVVKGWHTETFGSGLLAATPKIFRFVEPKVFLRAARAFGQDGMPLKVLVVPALPQSQEARDQSVALLRSKGVDAVILFRSILANLIERTEVNRNYQQSDLLQVIRIFKNYDFFKEPQLELFKTRARRR
ncbi:MAG TPA: hypothetical protein GYA07_04990 [Verrucomicrobia bacterium]|nr:hypothetical protein [Verrucomicrobiota bacterium]HOB31451.1 hypothetical protein [Verrucomicrobiota bacterium]HOP96370.1 hypothetical protein [Verrucomicrobiota bacterium]HPU57308.1 hypothetical protein [Verrucomicrobiota bacterium]